jgi:hypothetical protein
MWKFTQHKTLRGQQDLRVCVIVRELGECFTTDPESLKAEFEQRVKQIPRTNSFDAHLVWKVVTTETEAQFWKTSAGGELKDKYFTLKRE